MKHVKGLWTALAENHVVHNQNKLIFTFFAIGYSGVNGTQWLSSLGFSK